MKKFLIILLISVTSLGMFYFLQKKPVIRDHSLHTIRIGEVSLEVEFVNTTESITTGLSYRKSIGSDGMLFVFQTEVTPTFWMKDMHFPLDFIWIRSGQVVDTTIGVPAPAVGTPLSQLPVYSPSSPVTHVLEVPAGFIEQKKIAKGQVVILP